MRQQIAVVYQTVVLKYLFYYDIVHKVQFQYIKCLFKMYTFCKHNSQHYQRYNLVRWHHKLWQYLLSKATVTSLLPTLVTRACNTHTHTHPFNGPFSGTTWVSRYQKGKINLDVTEARDSEWQWHQLGHMQVCISLQTDNHASTPPLKSFLQAGCPSCRQTNSVNCTEGNNIQIIHGSEGDTEI